MGEGRILVVEDRASLRRMFEHALVGEGYDVVTAADAGSALATIDREAFDLVLTDLKLPDGSGLEVVKASRERTAATPVLVLTAFGTVETAVEAMKLGATDFLEKPVEIEDLFSLVESLLALPVGDACFTTERGTTIVGSHPHLKAALRLLERVAPTASTVLLTGESGTGKELFARALHELSERAEQPFVAVNCAAIPESLIESELFGHEKGAFTGAHRRRAGRFELAEGGTLFLDEIGDLDRAVQSKVLRVLEERNYERVGGQRTLDADVRLVAATNRDLAAMVAQGDFRSDLLFRLDVFPIELPPLRERPEDVAVLARHLLVRLAERHGREVPEIEPAAVDLLAAQPWPGNVRQLANWLERALILAEGATLRIGEFAGLVEQGPGDERAAVEEALRASDGDKKAAAELLGVSYRTLQRRVRKHKLEGFPKYRE